MGRTIVEILSGITTQQASMTALTSLNSPSQTAIYTLVEFITANAIFTEEQLWDLFRAELETTVANAPLGTDGWIQSEMFKFQYDSIIPQILTLNNFVPSYNPVDLSKRIITKCSVITNPNKIVSIKLAKSDPPLKLNTAELIAAQGYLDKILFAGVQYDAISRDPDLIYLDADITYDGQYSTSISAITKTATINYLRNIPFDGYIKIVSLVDAIQSVSGVTDVVINNLTVRPNAVGLSAATYLVQNNTTLLSKYPLFAGYIVEDVFPNDFNSTLTYIPQ